MIYKGNRYIVCRTVVQLPRGHWTGESNNYVAFGRIVPKGTPGAVITNYGYHRVLPQNLWGGDTCPPPDSHHERPVAGAGKKTVREPYWHVWAVPIPCEGHSLTNLMYAPKGYLYLLHSGQVYVRRIPGRCKTCKPRGKPDA